GGSYTFTVKTQDNAGNVEATGVNAGPVTADSTAPGNVPTRSATAIAAGKIRLDWTEPADADFKQVNITWTGGGSQSVEKGTMTFTTGALTNGTSYTFTFKTQDNAGNEATGVTASATADNVPPTVTITAPAADAVVNGTQALTFTVTGGTATTTARIGIGTLTDFTSGNLLNTLNGWAGTVDGTVTVTLSNTDAAGNIGTATRDFTRDTTPPSFSAGNVTVTPDSNVNNNPTIAISAITEANGVASILYWITGQITPSEKILGTPLAPNAALPTTQLPSATGGLVDSKTSFFFQLVDLAGNIGGGGGANNWIYCANDGLGVFTPAPVAQKVAGPYHPVVPATAPSLASPASPSPASASWTVPSARLPDYVDPYSYGFAPASAASAGSTTIPAAAAALATGTTPAATTPTEAAMAGTLPDRPAVPAGKPIGKPVEGSHAAAAGNPGTIAMGSATGGTDMTASGGGPAGPVIPASSAAAGIPDAPSDDGRRPEPRPAPWPDFWTAPDPVARQRKKENET
ncbi:MAG: hypothetical protein NT080_02780, partial [Spirochaetes bacterium]|nr:hypothetical protein [Spirochaetota bacterium]